MPWLPPRPPLPPRPSARQAALTAAVVALANLPLLRTAWLHFGATEAELDATLPGDDIVEQANLVATRAVTIAAPREEVWRWVVQIGADRGGFYSYDGLENLVGCGVVSADQVEERWQHLAPGDRVYLHPSTYLAVAEATENRALVLHGDGSAPDAPMPDFTWAFVLHRAQRGGTRLVIRERYGYRSGWDGLIVEPVSFVSFVMTEKMMRGIRARAERAAQG
ncbi:MAG: SRPBCC family protein [Micrococcales bacterium]|nr:SRPBCC family protein [Micrococcales bacterium]